MTEKIGQFVKTPAIVVLLIFTIGLFSLYSLSNNQAIWKILMNNQVPLISYLSNAELDATVANLWFNELMLGDDSISFNDINEILNRAKNNLKYSLASQKNLSKNDLHLQYSTDIKDGIIILTRAVEDFQSVLNTHFKTHQANHATSLGNADIEESYADLITISTQLKMIIRSQNNVIMVDQQRVYQGAILNLGGSLLIVCLMILTYMIRQAKKEATLNRIREQSYQEANDQLEHLVKQRTQELQKSNQELEQFAYVASHDLQQPLRTIHGFGEVLLKRSADQLDEANKQHLDRIIQAANRMHDQIQDLLAYSRLSSSDAEFATIDLKKIIEKVKVTLDADIQHSGCQINTGTLKTFKADERQINQLFENLIGNAIKYRKEETPPQININAIQIDEETDENASASHPMIKITVKDNGIGFEEKNVTRIFKMFDRLHGIGKYQGTGIGLAICKKIAENHQGSITAISKPNEGSTFIITLPEHQLDPELA